MGTSGEMWEIFTFAKRQNTYYMASRVSLVSSSCHSVIKSCPTPCQAWHSCLSMDFSMPGCSVFCCLLVFAHIHVHWVSDAIQPSHPLPSPFPFAFNISQHQGLFQWALRLRWPKCWSFSISISPSNEYSGSVSFRMDWFGLLAVQGTLKSLLQHHRSLNYPSWFFQNNPEVSYYYLHFTNEEKIYQEDEGITFKHKVEGEQ